MLDPLPLLLLLAAYVCALALLARASERRARAGADLTATPLVYSLGLAAYCTSWTFYGSVGKAVDSGLLFLTIYLGPTLCAALWPLVLSRLARLKASFHVSSVADLLAARYGKSHRIAALATAMAFIGSVPYVALQLKSVVSTFTLLVGEGHPAFVLWAGPLVTVLLALLTILFGVRRMDPTDRHPGLAAVVAAQSVLKLAAMAAAGFFALSLAEGGPSTLFDRLSPEALRTLTGIGQNGGGAYVTWGSYLLLAASAVLFLPHQFHLAVVENADEDHVRQAMWRFPLYLLCINLFVLPIAAAGLALGLPPAEGDTFVLALPLLHGAGQGAGWLAPLVFLGGFSAAMSMVMVSATTNAVMLTNHVLLPIIEQTPGLAFLKRRLLECRWASVGVLLLLAYWFERQAGGSHILVNIGIISFGAALQFAPAILGGIFWSRGTRAGAFAGLSAGFLVWLHTMFLPSLARNGNFWEGPLLDGLFGLSFLRPEALFGLTALDPVSHTVFWSMLFNVGAYVLVSRRTRQDEAEVAVLAEFTGMGGGALSEGGLAGAEADLAAKRELLEQALRAYMPLAQARELLEECLRGLGLTGRAGIPVLSLAELYGEVEKAFSGIVGAAAAHKALLRAGVFSPEETRTLSEAYGNLLAEMRVTPEELSRRVDYHKERERLLVLHADELRETIRQREEEIVVRRRAEEALREAEEKYRGIFENAPEGIFQTTEGGRFLTANPAMARILGYSSSRQLVEEVTDIARQIYAMPDGRARLMAALADPRGVNGLELPMRRRDGAVIWGSIIARGVRDVTGRVVRVEGLLSDVTERKKAIEDLRESEARIRALFDATSDSVILMEPDGLILSINAHGAGRRGLTPEFMAGRCIYEHLPPHAAAQRRMQVEEAVRTASPRAFEEERDGFHYALNIYPVLDAEGRVRQLASFSRDITAQKEYEATIRGLNESLEQRVVERTAQLEAANRELTETLGQLTRAQRQLVESEKMASLGGLVAGVAHEINTPVGIGVTAASHLEQRVQAMAGEYRAGGLKRASLESFLSVCEESARMILANLNRASELIRSFKQVAVDRSSEEKRVFGLRGYLDEVLLSLRPHLKKTSLTVMVRCPDDMSMDSYPGALSQVITNLVMNSLAHAYEPDEGGVIRIEAEPDPNGIRLIYADNGRGIPLENLDKIFEPFYTTKRGRGGTGLGLHIVYNIVTQKLGGSIRCESAPGKGATFIMVLPVQAPAQGQ